MSTLSLVGCAQAPTVPPSPSPRAAGILAERAAHTATAVDSDTVIVAGGCVVDGCGEATTSVFLVGAAMSRPTGPLNDARDAHTGTLLGDEAVLVVGGFAGEDRPPLASAEVYDVATERWTLTSRLTVPRGGHAAALLGDGRVLVAGGWIGSRRYTATTEIYDPASRTFSAGPDLPVPVDGLTATSLDDGSVLVVGGQVRPGVANAEAVVVSRDGAEVQQVGSLRRARFKHAAVRLASGEVLIAGGTSNDRDLLASTEIYDPATQSFRPGPTMSAGRYKLAGGAVALPDGRVVVAGSGPGLEIIDPARFTSRTATIAAATASSFATATLVGATVRVIGGYDRSIRLSGTDLAVAVGDLG